MSTALTSGWTEVTRSRKWVALLNERRLVLPVIEMAITINIVEGIYVCR